MDYSRNSHANKLAIIKGLFDFAHGVPFNVFACNSRVAYTVSYGAVQHCLEELSQQEARLIVERARDHTRAGVVVMDNVQNYLMQRDIRIGRTHTMNVGLAATYVELEGIHLNALRCHCNHRLLCIEDVAVPGMLSSCKAVYRVYSHIIRRAEQPCRMTK